MGKETKILRFHYWNEYILLVAKFIPMHPLYNLTKKGYEVYLPALPSQRILVYDGKKLLLEETALWKRAILPTPTFYSVLGRETKLLYSRFGFSFRA